MKNLISVLLLVLTLAMVGPVQAQTYDESVTAYDRKDYQAAFIGFKKLAEQGNANAQVYLGYMYDNGRGVPKDERQALAWYRKAADQGHASAQFNLGVMYTNGRGAPKDERQAVAWYRKAADQGHAGAQFNLGIMYANGRGLPKDERQAAVWYRKAADQGDADAQFNLGTMYANGRGLPKDEQQAAAWYRKAADQGDADAQFNLGYIYESGLGVAKDERQAMVWYRKAADQGSAIAQFNLGTRYENGLGVAKDERQAVAWYRKAADQGYANAQNNLGTMYADGSGVTKDEPLAVAWYRKAADQGLASAQFNLGNMYANGRGVPKDERQAVAWYRKAAEQGDADAQFNLGHMYANGLGVAQDDQSAYFWWLLSSAQGDENAITSRDVVENSLSREQRIATQAAASAWEPKTAAQSIDVMDGNTAGSVEPDAAPRRPPVASDEADATGSGFRVAPGAIITNHHVIDGCSRLRVNGVEAKLRGSDEHNDLALLEVTLPGPSAALRTQRAEVGEPVAVVGYPLRGWLSGFNMTTGNLSSLSGLGGDTRYLQITAPVQPGNSGGPMLDSGGNLAGVVVSKLDVIEVSKITGDMAQNVNFAINVSVLRLFLEAYRVEYVSSNVDKPLPPTVIADKARGFTVLVECWK